MLLFLFNNLRHIFFSKHRKIESKEKLPVTLIVTACNEEKILEQKIKNTLAIDYPEDKLKIIFVKKVKNLCNG